MDEMTIKADTEDLTLDEEINALLAKAVREGISESEFARFQHLTARRSMLKRPQIDRRLATHRSRLSHAF